MNNKELEIIIKIFELKQKKTECINIQSYESAADFRDKERDYELKLLEIIGFSSVLSSEFPHIANAHFLNLTERKIKMNEYFTKNFGIEYPNNMNSEFRKTIIRQIKLNKLGI
jgi:hypothetical protein